MKNIARLSALLIFVFSAVIVFGQSSAKGKIRCIAFYNLENLYDTINQPNVDDEEFTPDGKNKWNSKKYHEKISNMSEVISKLGIDVTSDGPAIMGLAEIENRSVVEDLINTPLLKDRGYKIIHYDSPDARGVDVALIYQSKYFTVTNSTSNRLYVAGVDNFRSRNQLVVSGILDGEPISFVVNHWPSRGGGQKPSEPKRIAAAELSRHLVDSLLALNPKTKIMVMGDLNDDPTDLSVKQYLNTSGDAKALQKGQLFNPMVNIFKSGIGTLEYRGVWNLFDQIILSPALTGTDKKSFKFDKAEVYNKPWITEKTGNYKGYPFRTYAGEKYLGGYSDHFPVMVFIKKGK